MTKHLIAVVTVAVCVVHVPVVAAAREPAWAALVDGKLAARRFSFVYGGRHSSEFLHKWQRREGKAMAAAGRLRRDVTYRDPDTGLELTCELTTFKDYPASDWILRLRNTGTKDTPILERILPLDAQVPLAAEPPVVLHHSNGSTAVAEDFTGLLRTYEDVV